MKTLKDEIRRVLDLNSEMSLAEMPGFAQWVKRILPLLAGRTLAKNGFDYDMNIGGRHYDACPSVDCPSYRAILNSDGSVTIYRDDKEGATILLDEQELVQLVARRINDSWHLHWKQWDIWDWDWD